MQLKLHSDAPESSAPAGYYIGLYTLRLTEVDDVTFVQKWQLTTTVLPASNEV